MTSLFQLTSGQIAQSIARGTFPFPPTTLSVQQEPDTTLTIRVNFAIALNTGLVYFQAFANDEDLAYAQRAVVAFNDDLENSWKRLAADYFDRMAQLAKAEARAAKRHAITYAQIRDQLRVG